MICVDLPGLQGGGGRRPRAGRHRLRPADQVRQLLLLLLLLLLTIAATIPSI